MRGTVLRSLMRQDPNVIMVGEIRDEEVAQIVGQAAYTGHLVLSSVHTVDAATAVTRLTNLGLEAYKVAESLAAVLAQRLFRVGEIPQVGVPAYTRVDARVERPLTRALTAAIAGQNLFDRTHVEATDLLAVTTLVPRRVMAQIVWRFAR